MDDDNQSEGEESSHPHDEVLKEFRKKVNSLQVSSKDGLVSREAGFLSIEKSQTKNFHLVWRTLAGQNPISVEISSKTGIP